MGSSASCARAALSSEQHRVKNETLRSEKALQPAVLSFKHSTLLKMGKGDKKSRKGKRTRGSHGKSRPNKRKVMAAKKAGAKKAAPKKKAAAKKAAPKKKAAAKKK